MHTQIVDYQKRLEYILNEGYLKQQPPFYTKFPFHYYVIPGTIRKMLGKVLYKIALLKSSHSNSPVFPEFPIDYSVHNLMKQVTHGKSPIRKPTLPKGKTYTLCLTHDVDSRFGYEQMDNVVSLEKKYHVTSTFFLPTHLYEVDFRYLRKLQHEGFEIGIHGYNHDGRDAFLPKKKMRQKIQDSFNRFNEHLAISGFRSPAYLRTPELFNQLKDYYQYDSSVPDTHNYKNSKPNYGCCSIYPFIRENGLLELPVTLPDDATLLLYGFNPEQILKLWKEKLAMIKKLGGVAVLLTHPEPHFSGNKIMLGIYGKFLKEIIKDQTCWITTYRKLSQNLKPYQ